MLRLEHGPAESVLAHEQELAGKVCLTITSPPYNVGFDYGGEYDDKLDLGTYLIWLNRLIVQVFRVTIDGGILALNLPPSIRTPHERAYPLGAWAQLAMRNAGWLLREPLVWVKGKDGPQAYGTAIGAPTNPYLRPTHELVLLGSKAQHGHPHKHPWPEAYIEQVKDVWLLTAGKARKGEPTQFPQALVDRLIRLYTGEGCLVLDPCMGLGSVPAAAARLGRSAWGIDISSKYVKLASERVAGEHRPVLIDAAGTPWEQLPLNGA